jgi:hypothetical protein|tara:strand:+ start:355 stop:480 length:126 start_codon:yes stop_codon:yes gene_type:complete
MFDKITKGTIDGTKSAKDFTIKKWKKFNCSFLAKLKCKNYE